jgi:hypothetical protein
VSEYLFKIARNGVVTGDFTVEQIKAGLASGDILGSDNFYDPDLKAWRFVSEKDWQADGRIPKPEEKSIWIRPIKGLSGLSFLGCSWNYFWCAIGIAILRGALKLLGKSSPDTKVIGWTIVATIIATFLYFIIRDRNELARNSTPQDKAYRPRYLWRGYIALVLSICLTGVFLTNKGQQAWHDLDPLRKDFKYEVWSDFNRDIFPCVEIAFSKLNAEALEKLIETEKDDAHEFNQDKTGSTIGIRLYDVRKGDRYEIKVQSDGRPPDRGRFVGPTVMLQLGRFR